MITISSTAVRATCAIDTALHMYRIGHKLFNLANWPDDYSPLFSMTLYLFSNGNAFICD